MTTDAVIKLLEDIVADTAYGARHRSVGRAEQALALLRQPDECALIDELKVHAKAAEANPEPYRDGWECAMQCAINIARQHKRESGNQPVTKCETCHGLGEIHIRYDDHGKRQHDDCPTCKRHNLAPMALRRLVNLKKHKEKHGKDAYYEFEQPIAWRMADEALTEIEGQQP